jgi:acetyl-CoA C-acetyltransferase
MSLAHHVLPKSREGKRMGHWELQDVMIVDGLWCSSENCHMGITAENIAEMYKYNRAEQDLFAATSQQRTEAAQKQGVFDAEIIPLEIPQRKGDPLIFAKDEFPRTGTTPESLAKLKPAFLKEGSVTAGNASGVNDGAAAVLVMSARKAAELNLKPMARIVSFGSAGVNPAIMGTGPVPAVRKCLDRAGWTVGDLDLIEANEAFAAQAMSVAQELGFPPEKTNVSGGAIAIGHPIGASGARILVTLVHGLQRLGLNKGLATLCIGGGQGVAMAIEGI